MNHTSLRAKRGNPVFSIIIPVRIKTAYLSETIKKLKLQTFKNFEILIITDKISGSVSPAVKRNLGAKKAGGECLAFLDDDSYPHKDWLKNTYHQIKLHSDYAGFCGPCLTPSGDNIYQKASALVWSSSLGSGGAGTYRNSIQKPRLVDDYPSVNLIIKKRDFNKINGFNTHHWPGEDTILCLNLTKKLKKNILYHPSILVYHHRREIIIPHLQQITRYALHRGNFARIFPKTSLRLGYLMPSICVLYLIFFPILYSNIYYLTPYLIYSLLLFLTFLNFLHKKNHLIVSLLAAITIPITHAYYGLLFIIGFFTKDLDFHPHEINKINNKYVGG